ncbi:MAG: tRNA (adenosine(37)-N6)-dimethylallyltransferase MiaA [Chloroflexi bacterium]|nr:MAG: tRNA (adenosine(37)-N6)-dimethylallyltransferase MiaA [Chloroflexota bacterium]
MKRLIAIVGPTAMGKSRLALGLARALDAEIVNADSRQVYRYMDIGTAKPGLQERSSVPHHLIDIVDPDVPFSLALYQSLAYAAIEDILRRGKQPLLVGGSGLYVWSVIENWRIPRVPPDPRFRRQMEELAATEGAESLYRRLQELDPEAARNIDLRNVRRVIRALEVCQATGAPFSEIKTKQGLPFDTLIIGLTCRRDHLYQRIDARVDNMIQQGLVDEVRGLMERGYGFDLPAMSSVGYRQVGKFLLGETDLATAVQQIKFETHRFARHQYAWFRLTDKRVYWIDTDEEDAAEKSSMLITEGTRKR